MTDIAVHCSGWQQVMRLGTTVEFRSQGTFSPVTDMIGGGPFGLKPGEWTDDTSMALCLAVSLINPPARNCFAQPGKGPSLKISRALSVASLCGQQRYFPLGPKHDSRSARKPF